MFNITVTKIRCLEDTAGPGNDEPYVIVFAADLNTTLFVPLSGAALYGPFDGMNDEEIWGDTEVDVNGTPFWGFDGQPRDIENATDVIILVGLCESDHDKNFSNSVRTMVQAGVKGELATLSAAGADPGTIRVRLREDMEGFIDTAIRSDLERDERLGPVQAFTITPADLEAEFVERTLTFVSAEEESKYEVTLRISAQIETASSALNTASKKLRYAAIWEKGPGAAQVARHGMTSAKYQEAFNDLTKQGYRLVEVNGSVVNGVDLYAAIWEKKSGPEWVARHRMTSASYQQEFNKLAGQGYRLVYVSGYGADGKDSYAAIWEKKSGPEWVARHRMSSVSYQQEFNKLVGQGYRLVHVSGYGFGGKDHYAAIWEKKPGPEWVARHRMTSATYQQEFTKLAGEGYRLVHVSGYSVGGNDFYAAIWEKKSGPEWVARHRMTSASYQQEFNKLVGQGYRIVGVSAYAVG